jgi:hypothetical protein
MKTQIALILEAAQVSGCQALVLSAFGCGAYGNPPGTPVLHKARPTAHKVRLSTGGSARAPWAWHRRWCCRCSRPGRSGCRSRCRASHVSATTAHEYSVSDLWHPPMLAGSRDCRPRRRAACGSVRWTGASATSQDSHKGVSASMVWPGSAPPGWVAVLRGGVGPISHPTHDAGRIQAGP